MADDNDSKQPNGALIVDRDDDSSEQRTKEEELTLFTILNRLISAIFFPAPNSSSPLLKRIKISLSENIPLLRDASTNTGIRLLQWTRRGSPLRALFVVSVGTIVSLTLAGLLVFMLFFVAATVNAIVISLVMSLAAAGGFLALFFACVAAIYIGALSVAVFVISTTTISCIIAVLIATGWIGFFWTLWIAAQKSIGLAKHSVCMTGSAISAYSTAWHDRRDPISKKSD
ncbi:voltage-dependent L-type calcium channel subunit [Perilla frutescens var. hirtella]|uniref:Voltage-dependent L-type calcium channel subunit n=1 Tax=Perilla frutescens var. hirtella TaxID=608512 RepID=A0AAD4ILC8_PERFH|nr:voltage-dependent L-type calcium channel subunit [Perilla frutescens var. hirtella]KAH6784563.1 voltage-dependent L-type calcium channel subunit [Perilla frutescens var. hirtella]